MDEPQQGGPGLVVDFPAGAGPKVSRFVPAVSFDRRELSIIALDFLRERALFSIYRRASERPLYVVEKNPRLRHKQGQYLVLSQEGRVLKRGHDLETVLRVLELAVVK